MFISAVAMPNTPAATSWRRVQPFHQPRDTTSSAIVAPISRNHATVCGSTSSNNITAIAAPMYWATAERTKSASGCVVFSHRVDRPRTRGGVTRHESRRSKPADASEQGSGPADLIPPPAACGEAGQSSSVEKFGFGARDLVPHRLEAEPSREGYPV